MFSAEKDPTQEVTVKSESVPSDSQSSPTIAVIVGAGFIKVAQGNNYRLIRSLINSVLPRGLSPSDELLKVVITDSHYKKTFAVGEQLDGFSGTRSLKQEQLKAEYMGSIILGVVASILQPVGYTTCKIIFSVPTPELQKQLETQLPGMHSVFLNDGDRSTLNVLTVTGIPESLSSAYALAKDSPVSVIDLGFMNSSVSGWDPNNNIPLPFHSLHTGVGDLFESIAAAINTTGQRPTAEAVRLGVEARTFKLNGHGDIEFRDIYDREFDLWVSQVITQVKDVAKASIDRCPYKYIVGGGSLLPGMGEIIKSMGFLAVDNPQRLEAEGALSLGTFLYEQ